MGKIYCIMGKSSSGKDTIFKMLLEEKELHLKTIVSYTTRPIRAGEQNGVEYFFCDDEKAEALEKEGKVIELRAYNTVHGVWKYFTVDDDQVCLEKQDYLIIGTLESFLKIREYYGSEKVIPIYIEVDDGLRLQRALDRERSQDTPKYAEMCRRFLADEADFSEENLKAAGIVERFQNIDLTTTEAKIASFIHEGGKKTD
ncbi:MAG: guanylate kinase [Roseburia sp.]